MSNLAGADNVDLVGGALVFTLRQSDWSEGDQPGDILGRANNCLKSISDGKARAHAPAAARFKIFIECQTDPEGVVLEALERFRDGLVKEKENVMLAWGRAFYADGA